MFTRRRGRHLAGLLPAEPARLLSFMFQAASAGTSVVVFTAPAHLRKPLLHTFNSLFPYLLLGIVEDGHQFVIHFFQFLTNFRAGLGANFMHCLHVLFDDGFNLLPLLVGQVEFPCKAFDHSA